MVSTPRLPPPPDNTPYGSVSASGAASPVGGSSRSRNGASTASLPSSLGGNDASALRHLNRSLSAVALNRSPELAAETDDASTPSDYDDETTDGEDDPKSKIAKGKARDEQSGEKKKQIVSVSISGSTSSGKTTLAILLAEVLTPQGMPGPVALAPFTDNFDATSSGHMTIHQDSFFYNKGACEFVTFQSLPLDADYCRATVQDDQVGVYDICETEKGNFKITGPNTDQISSLNMWGLLKAVVVAKENGVLPDIDDVCSYGRDLYGMSYKIRISKEYTDKVTTQYANLIANAKRFVANWTSKTAIENEKFGFPGCFVQDTWEGPAITAKFLITEGFIIFRNTINDTLTEDDHLKPDEFSEDEDEETSRQLRYLYGRLGFQTANESQKKSDDNAYKRLKELAEKFFAGVQLSEKEMEFIQEHHYQANVRAMKKLQSSLGIKLFLPTSRQNTLDTRMSRAEYIDEPLGLRKRGEMWKTVGYFDEVAWKRHVLNHNWLIDLEGKPLSSVQNGTGPNDVLVREVVDATVEQTLRWALLNILAKLGEMEKIEREKFVKN